MAEQKHVVYMLKCKDSTLYTGYSNNFEQRLKMHESGKGAKYTRGRGPFEVVLMQQFPTKEEAMKKEYEIKQLSRTEKILLIKQCKEGLKNEHTKEF